MVPSDSGFLTRRAMERLEFARKSPPPPPLNFGGKPRKINGFYRFSLGWFVRFLGSCSRPASLFPVSSTLVLISIFCPAAQAADLIRCPDWQRYVTPAVTLRTTPPKRSFDVALAESRPGESRADAANRAAGQGVPTHTPGRSSRPESNRANAESGAPLPLPEAFRRGTKPNIAQNSATNRTARGSRPSGQSAAQAPTRCQYSVVAGDTLSKIAARRLGDGKRWPELARANALTATSILRIGQSLHLPCAPGRQAGVSPSAPQSTTTPPLPVWTARPGEFVADVVDRWAKRAGHTVVRDGVEEWKITVPVRISGNFKDALDQLVVGFEGSGRPLAISLYANKVIRIGRPL